MANWMTSKEDLNQIHIEVGVDSDNPDVLNKELESMI